jgi:dinuclear metal center YbgI/SA1388 family protein
VITFAEIEMHMKLSTIIRELERLAPPDLQESYDNSGLITGNAQMDITGALICLDSIEAVLDEAIRKNCNLIVAHHPIVFSGLKKITGKNYIERVIIKAIKNDIAIYAIHTNLDNVWEGVNQKIAEKIGLTNCRILSPMDGKLIKLVTYCPTASAEKVSEAMFAAGAGHIGKYSECSFKMEGTGTFKAGNDANPFVGEKNIRHSEAETRIEVILESRQKNKVLTALKESHPYEEIAYDIYRLENKNTLTGAGMIGELPQAVAPEEFLKSLKTNIKTDCIRHTSHFGKSIQKVAVCGGSGSFLLAEAIASGADIFITGDFKYHQFFDADGKIIIADVGHFESEQHTIELLGGWLREIFPTFAVHLTEINTNPINYI